MSIGSIILDGVNWVYQEFLERVAGPLFLAIQSLVIGSNNITSLPFFDPLQRAILAIATGLFILISLWQLTKCFLAYAGVQSDDPYSIGFRLFISYILMYFSKDVLLLAVDLVYEFIQVMNSFTENHVSSQARSLPVSIFSSIFESLFLSSILTVSSLFQLYIIYKVILLFIRMYLRQILTAILIVTAPLAAATAVSKNTSGFLSGFLKVFVGNLTIQFMQFVLIAALTLCSSVDYNQLGSLMIMVGILYCSDRLEEVIREMSMSVGLGRDMSGAISTMQSGVSALNSARSLASFIGGGA